MTACDVGGVQVVPTYWTKRSKLEHVCEEMHPSVSFFIKSIIIEGQSDPSGSVDGKLSFLLVVVVVVVVVVGGGGGGGGDAIIKPQMKACMHVFPKKIGGRCYSTPYLQTCIGRF